MFLHLAVTATTVSVALIKEENKIQLLVYYISQALIKEENKIQLLVYYLCPDCGIKKTSSILSD